MKRQQPRSELERACRELPIEIESAYHGLHKQGDWEHFLWNVTLKYQGNELQTQYKLGVAHCTLPDHINGALHPGRGKEHRHPAAKPTPPAIADVVHSLISDDPRGDTFEDWADNFGYDTDSRKALQVYLACQESAKKIRQLLGNDLVDRLAQLEH